MPERLSRAWFALALPLLVLAAADIPFRRTHWLTDRFFLDQDLPVLAAISAAAALFWLLAKRRGGFEAKPQPFSPGPPASRGQPGARRSGEAAPRRLLARTESSAAERTAGETPAVQERKALGLAPIGLALLCAIVGACGVQLVCDGYPLSMDEFLATFDATVIGHGQAMAPLAPAWRPFAPALQTMFMLPTPGAAFLISGYLPMNSALRALASMLDAAWLLNPALAALSVLAVYFIARRLWPDRADLALIAAGLLATSCQFLVTAMTPYAMTAHLALNLVWLWLFLGEGWRRAGALVVAFVACGLHQIIFHPLFAAPFILQMWWERRWRDAALFTFAYAGICLFWASYPAFLAQAAAMAASPGASAESGVRAVIDHAVILASAFDVANTGVMAKNLIRFVTWQNPITIALLGVALVPAIRAGGTLRSLAMGLGLTVAAMFVLLPYQGHGWGYRYLHGLLGSTCLLAAFGWGLATDRLTPRARGAANRGFALAAAVSLVALLPLRAWQAHRFLDPYARAYGAIVARPDQIVLVDSAGIRFGQDFVRNDPYLRNRPLILNLGSLSDAQVNWLCDRYSISLFDLADARPLRVPTALSALPGEPARRGRYASCGPTRAVDHATG